MTSRPQVIDPIRLRWALLACVLLALLMIPRQARAQEGPLPIGTIEIFISKARMEPEKLWDRYVSKRGIDFVLDAGNEVRLRNAGADDAMIAMLRRATVRLPPAQQAVVSSAATRERPKMSRSELRWVYFDRSGAISTYVTAANLRETGGTVQNETMSTSRGPVRLASSPVHNPAILGGLVVHYDDFGLVMEGHFQPNLMMLNMGVSYDPFLPIGATGFRAILGATPFLSETRQIIGHTDRATGDTTSNDVELHNGVVGGDLRAGLAYHFRPGVWVFAERGYRMAITASRQIDVPGGETVSGGIPWSKWSARGSFWRFGIGW